MSEDLKKLIKKIHEKVEKMGINLHDYYIHDDEDLILFSLKWLADHIEDAFDLGN